MRKNCRKLKRGVFDLEGRRKPQAFAADAVIRDLETMETRDESLQASAPKRREPCTPIPRKIWKDGKVVRNAEDYGGWARQVADSQKAAFVDLDEIIARHYDALGEAQVEPLFADLHTHTSRTGAELNAECVVAGLKALAGNPLGRYLSDKGNEVAPDSGH